MHNYYRGRKTVEDNPITLRTDGPLEANEDDESASSDEARLNQLQKSVVYIIINDWICMDDIVSRAKKVLRRN
ncbi:hypothetical protein DID88_007380 [Monilinia fructigena]|uniref:Uncharacterized protein n=1 Tax=Monilinia fructigena TaxID=38457 RepID=A0A395J8K1_9HELO|nr:hypothetical protein DID88_007380 [Monilinia fructigena]